MPLHMLSVKFEELPTAVFLFNSYVKIPSKTMYMTAYSVSQKIECIGTDTVKFTYVMVYEALNIMCLGSNL